MDFILFIMDDSLPILGLNVPIIVLLIMLVMACIFGNNLKKLKNLSEPVEKDLQELKNILSKYDNEISEKELDEITENIQRLNSIKNHWSEFLETIIKIEDSNGKIVVYNTSQIDNDVDNYINKEVVIDSNIHLKSFSSVSSTLTGLGLLGTFISILFGLHHVHISGLEVTGVDGLINGLAGKFLSSIIGLLLAMAFTHQENKILGKLEQNCYEIQHKINRLLRRYQPEMTMLSINNTLKNINPESFVSAIDTSMAKLQQGLSAFTAVTESINKGFETTFNKLDKIIEISEKSGNNELSEQFKGFRADYKDDSNKTRELLQEMNTSISNNITEQFKNLRTELGDDNKEIISILNSNFEETNRCLNEAVESLSKGATEEIVKALEQVIREFNEKLTEQFGENFKELNQAVFRLVEWQDNYKSALEQIEQQLQLTIISIQSTDSSLEKISQRNQEIVSIYDKLGETIRAYDGQVQDVNTRLKEYMSLNEQAKVMLSNIEKEVVDTSKNSQKAQEEILENTSKKLEEHTKNIVGAIVLQLEDTQKSLTEISGKMQGALTSQSESLAELSNKLPEHSAILNTRLEKASQDINDQLKRSLENMSSVLVGITGKFAEVYKVSAGIDR